MKYTSKSQIARVETEKWAITNLFCPLCGSSFKDSKNNTKVYDFSCDKCKQLFQLKSQNKPFGNKLIGSEYYSFLKSIENLTVPNFVLMQYSLAESLIKIMKVIFIPKVFITKDVVEKRKPLSVNARRAGWTGYNLLIKQIPSYGITPIVQDMIIRPIEMVLGETKRIVDLYTVDISKAKWKMELLKIVDKMPEEFNLAQIYLFSEILKRKFPENNHIEDKIRQQLQIIRDSGVIEFVGKGKYKKINPTSSSSGN